MGVLAGLSPVCHPHMEGMGSWRAFSPLAFAWVHKPFRWALLGMIGHSMFFYSYRFIYVRIIDASFVVEQVCYVSLYELVRLLVCWIVFNEPNMLMYMCMGMGMGMCMYM